MLFTDVQRSVRLNKKKKSTNTSPYPDEVIDRLARAFYPAILACWNSEEGQREFAAWQAEQAYHTPSKEKQSVPDGERSVVHIVIVRGFSGCVRRAHPIFVSSWLGVRQTAFTGSFSPWLHRGWFCAVLPSGRTIPPLQGRREQRRHWFWYPVRRSFPCPQRTA